MEHYAENDVIGCTWFKSEELQEVVLHTLNLPATSFPGTIAGRGVSASPREAPQFPPRDQLPSNMWALKSWRDAGHRAVRRRQLAARGKAGRLRDLRPVR